MSKRNKSVDRSDRRGRRVYNNERLIQSAQQEPPRPPRRGNREIASPLNDAQRAYDAAMHSSDIIFGTGPAGTGKTWFAAKRAAEALDAGVIEKIIVTRPAVTAEEDHGFLPGELSEKYEPYFRPVRDALEEHYGSSALEYMIKVGIIEPRPLAFLRGATLKNCWVIADEMQNATKNQFKMFLSRIGENAKFIINGDPRQTDLSPGQSGLLDAVNRLRSVPRVSAVHFLRTDIVRSGMAQLVVEAYEEDDEVSDEGLNRTLGI